MPRRAAVLGHPVGHSLSPVLHTAAYDALGLDWTYDAVDVDSGGLGAFLAQVDAQWAGLSLTMPLKVEAVSLVDFVEPMAKLLGVVNTVIVGGSGTNTQLVGANTDVYGVVTALAEAGVAKATTAVVIGGGATAVSAVAALGQLGCTRPRVAVRSRARAGAVLRASTAMGLSPTFIALDDPQAMRLALHDADAVVSTIPAAAGAELATGIGEFEVPALSTLLDVVYDPLVTPLAQAWTGWGGSRVGGERMLLHQAAEQVRLMTGRKAPIKDMDAALCAVLNC